MLENGEQWIADYKEVSGGKDPGPYSIQTYEAVKVMAQAMTDAGGTDSAKVVEALDTAGKILKDPKEKGSTKVSAA